MSLYERFFQADLSSIIGRLSLSDEELPDEESDDRGEEYSNILQEAIKETPNFQLLTDEEKEIYMHFIFGTIKAGDMLAFDNAENSNHLSNTILTSETTQNEINRNERVRSRMNQFTNGNIQREAQRYKERLTQMEGAEIETENSEEEFFFF